METQSSPDSTLAGLLQNEIDCATVLLQFLQNESARLASDASFIDNDNTDKLRLLEGLQQATHTRIQFASAHSLPLQAATLQQAASKSESAAVVATRLARLAKLGQQLVQENRLIGQLINRRSQFINRVLDSLTPASHNSGAITYEENGSVSGDFRNSLLDLSGI
ncbi:MAG: flagellar protein FlgN [Gammaproteobacteria bacterium]|jgi:flagellar biosynthesis/type III secretory pathway chaperone